MAGFSNIVCTKEFVKGPTCREVILEDTDQRQKDCIERAKLQMSSELVLCAGRLASQHPFYRTRNPCGGDFEHGTSDPYSFTPCVKPLDSREGGACFCSGLEGMVCTSCTAEPTEDLDPSPTKTNITEKRLPQISVPNSNYGIPIPKTFGRIIVSTNIIWIGQATSYDNITRVTTGDQVTVNVVEVGVVDFCVGVCVGEIDAISRIWLNDVLIYNSLAQGAEGIYNPQMLDSGFSIEIAKGSDAQKVNTYMASIDGFGKTPAYRDLVYILLKNYPVEFSNANIPAVTVEVFTDVDNSRQFEVSNVTAENIFTVDQQSFTIFTDHATAIDCVSMDSTPVAELATYNNLILTDQGDFITVSGRDVKVISGASYTTTADTTLTYDGPMYMDSTSFAGKTHIAVASANKFETLVWDSALASLTSTAIHTLTDGGDPVWCGADNYSYGTNTNTVNKYIGIYQKDDTINFATGYLTTTNAPVVLPYAFTGTFIDAFNDLANGAVVVITAESTGIMCRALRVTPTKITYLWETILPAYTKNASATKQTQGPREYIFIAGQYFYILHLATGAIEVLGTLGDAPLPSVNNTQYYDGARGSLFYTTTDNTLVKVYPYMTKASDAMVEDILEYVSEDIAPVDIDTWPFYGYLISNQQNGAEVVAELAEFFDLTVSNTGYNIKVTSRGNRSQYVIDKDHIAEETRVKVAFAEDSISGVEITYYGPNGENTQSVSRDLVRPVYEDYVDNTSFEDFTFPVSCSEDVARWAAERILLRRLYQSSTIKFKGAAWDIKMEAGDYVFGEYVLSNVVLDVPYHYASEGTLDDPFIYDFTSGLTGVPSVNNGDPSVISTYEPLRVYPKIYTLPPSRDGLTWNEYYIGTSVPSYTSFTNADIYTNDGTNTTFVYGGTVTRPVLTGRLVTTPLYTVTPFTTDRKSVMTIKFDTPVGTRITSNTEAFLRERYRNNLLFVGDELIQFAEADIEPDGVTVHFRVLSRALLGTHYYTNTHVVGEECILYEDESLITASPQAYTTSGIAVATNDITSRTTSMVQRNWYNTFWGTGGMSIKIMGEFSFKRVCFRSSGTIPYTNTFTASSGERDPSHFRVFVAVLKAPYDEALFLKKLAEGGFSKSGSDASASTNDYIARILPFTGTGGACGSATSWYANPLASDGFTFEGPFYFASFCAFNSNAEIVTPVGGVTGFFFDSVDYTNFRSGLQLRNV